MPDQDRAQRVSRLRYRSWRRGTREMDLMLGPFADRHLAAMNETDLATYERLLNESDPDLMNWLSGQVEPPPEMDSDLRALLRRAAEVIRQSAAAAAERRKTS